MNAAEIGRQRAAALHDEAVAKGADPTDPYAFACAEAKRHNLDVEAANPGATVLKQGRASYVPKDELIVHENIGSPFEQAFLVAHEIGHVVLGDGPTTIHEVDASRPAEPSPVGFDRVVDYGRVQRREIQMDLFARELLLPRHLVKRLHLDGMTASDIARHLHAPLDVVAQQLLDALLLPAVMIEEQAPQAARALNKRQGEAAAHRGGAFLLKAGPGTGKTQTLTGRVEALLAEDVDPRRILVLTFSNKAAGEMAERIARKHPDEAAAMWIGTFHAFGLDLVRRFSDTLGLPDNPRMMDRTEAVELLEKEFPKLGLRHYRNIYDPTRIIGDLLSAISRAKDEVCDADNYARLAAAMVDAAEKLDASDPSREDALVAGQKAVEVGQTYAAYERLKRAARCIDFGDLVMLPVRLLEGNEEVHSLLQQQYDHVLVDEYQDVNRSSVRLIEALCPTGINLWVVGDAKQSIYRFRGASSFNIARFGKQDFPSGERAELELNYRSVSEIVDGFSAFASKMAVADNDLALKADRGLGGDPIELQLLWCAGDQMVALADTITAMRDAGHPYRDQVVLCGGNEKLAETGRDLERLGIPILFLGSLFERPEVKDLLCLLSLLVDGRGMGIVRTATLSGFALGLEDVAVILDTLRASDEAGCGWLERTGAMPLSGQGKQSLGALRAALSGFDETAMPWTVLATLLLDRTRFAADIATAGSVAGRSRGIAIWQFMNFVKVQPAAKGLPIQRLLDRVRRLVRIGDDRDLRQLPAAAQGIDAVRLMTIHGAKGLEFPVVHLAGMNKDTMPGSPKPVACLPPIGMIEGVTGDALAAHRIGEAEERECLFYVAASRARDRLFFYAVTHNAAGATRPLSPFLERFGPGLVRRTVTPSRSLPLAPEATPVTLDIQGPLRFSGSQLSLYTSCARRFFYTHILRIGGKRTETDYMRMHEAVRAITRDIVADTLGIDLADDAALAVCIAQACAAQGLEEDHVLADLHDLAAGMVHYFIAARAGLNTESPAAMVLAIDNDIVTFRPDDIVVASDGTRILRRVRTGHMRSDEAKDVGAAVFMLAAAVAAPTATVELVHLADEAGTVLDLSDKVLGNRRKTLSAHLAGIRAGMFPIDPSERICPNCPAFFVCGPTPEGVLQKKF